MTSEVCVALSHATERGRCLRAAVDTRVKPWHDGKTP
jgi:hypothetical protein